MRALTIWRPLLSFWLLLKWPNRDSKIRILSSKLEQFPKIRRTLNLLSWLRMSEKAGNPCFRRKNSKATLLSKSRQVLFQASLRNLVNRRPMNWFKMRSTHCQVTQTRWETGYWKPCSTFIKAVGRTVLLPNLWLRLKPPCVEQLGITMANSLAKESCFWRANNCLTSRRICWTDCWL